MKSLHQFMAEKNLTLAVRLNTNPLSVEDISVKDNAGAAGEIPSAFNTPHCILQSMLTL